MMQAPALLSLPLSLHRGTAFITFALAIFIVAAHTVIAEMAAARTSLPAKARSVGHQANQPVWRKLSEPIATILA